MAPLPSVEEIVCRLQKCRIDKDIQTTKQIHLHLCENGLDFHNVLGNHLVPTLIQCESLSNGQQVFNRLPHPREVSWTSLIQGYVELGEASNGFQIFERMYENSVYLSKFTFSVTLKACAKLVCLDKGRMLHSFIMKKGMDNNLFIGNALVDMYAKCGSLVESQGVFDVLQDRDLVSWNALITGYAENGFAKEALAFFERLQCEGIPPDVTTFLSVLKACSIIQAAGCGKEVHAMILKDEFEDDIFLGNTLVDMYAKCGLLEEAQEVFEELPLKDIVSWNALITGHAEYEHHDAVLRFWREMQLMGVSPNSGTYVRILQACSALGEAGRGQEAHSEVVERGLKDEFFVCNTLVDMYSKCGLCEDAHYMFDEISVHDAVSWNALIAGYSAHELKEDGLKILWEIRCEQVSPDFVTFFTILKACSSLGALEKGREIHTEISKLGFEDRFSGSSLVDLYAKCVSLGESRYVFDRLPDRDVVCWNVLISGYAEQGLNKEALECVTQMQYEGVCLDPGTYVCILQSCTINTGREFHLNIIQEEFHEVPSVSSALVNMYVRCGLLSEAEQVFDEQISHDVISWTALIAGYVGEGLNEEALNCLEQMQMEGISPNHITFVCALKACKLECLNDGRQLHAWIVLKGVEGDPLIGTSLVCMYAECSELGEAKEISDKMLVRDVLLWTALIAGYTDHGKCKEALDCVEQMLEDRVPPDPLTYVSALQACCSSKVVDMGHVLYSGAVKQGVEQDLYVGNALVEMYSKFDMLTELEDMFFRLRVRDLVSWTLLTGVYTEHGLVEEALNCLLLMQLDGITPDVVVWNFVISAFAEDNDYEKPVQLFAEMLEQGLLPDSAIFLSILTTCRNALAVDFGRRVHAQVLKLNEAEESKAVLQNALIDLYGKCGSVGDAEEVCHSMSTRGVLAWNALLIGYALHGESQVVFLLLEQMIESGVHPDDDSFRSVFIVCSHVGLCLEGQYFHHLMTEWFGITSTLKHLTCFVDLLARAGRLDFAQVMLERMPFQPDLVLLHAMLSACRMLGDVELGHEIFVLARNLDSRHTATYILMANIYTEGNYKDIVTSFVGVGPWSLDGMGCIEHTADATINTGT